MVYGPVHETFDPWSDCGWATFRDGDEVVDENCHIILGRRLGMDDKECEERKGDLADVWYDIGQDARDRYVDDFKRIYAGDVPKMFNAWYRTNRGRFENDDY